MGSFWGHVDEGLFFILIAFWWMVHAFREYIMAESQGQVMRPNMHYDVTCRGKSIPLEIIFKILFPVVGFMGEMLDGGIRFTDSEGHFVKLIYQQHMTIYGIFIIHGAADLITWLKLPIFPNMNYMTSFLAFTWYGVAFYYHANMHGKEPVEMIVHVMPIYVMFACSLAILLETKWRAGAWTMVVRSYCVLTLGTWFTHVAFMLYVHDRFPGGQRSNLDRSSLTNVTYVKAMFGLHLLGNLVFSLCLYLAVMLTLRVKLGVKISLQMSDEKEKKFKLGSPSCNGYHKVSTEEKTELLTSACDIQETHVTFDHSDDQRG